MNWLEQTIELIAPTWGAQRARSRLAIYAYEAARGDKHHKPKRKNHSPDTALGFAGASLREQVRWLDDNHDLVIGLLDKMEERIIGSKGIQVEPLPRSLTGEVHTELAQEIRHRWAEWSLKPEVTGRLTRPAMERLVARHWLRDGESFAQQVRGMAAGFTHPSGSAYSLELLPAEFIPLDLTRTYGDRLIKQGCELNQWGQIKAFHVYLHHPREFHSRQTKLIKAENMLHIAYRRNFNQLRGITLLHGVIKRLADLKDYEESERVAARIAAALAFYIKRGDPATYDPNVDRATQRQISFGPGTTFDDLAPGEDVGMIESNRPNTHLAEFRNGQLRAVAAGSRSSNSSLSRNYSGSYSSQRQELVEQSESFAVLQDEFIGQWARPNYRAWLQMEQLHPTNPLLLPPDLDLTTLLDAAYFGPTMPWIDPKKEADGWRTLIRGGSATEAEWCRARGADPDEVKRKRLAEIQWNDQHRLVLDTDPRHVSSSGAAHKIAEPEGTIT